MSLHKRYFNEYSKKEKFLVPVKFLNLGKLCTFSSWLILCQQY